jgi:lipoprotein-releasing system permease protein
VSLSFELALRYLTRRPSQLISFVSVLAAGGVALGVTALVVAMGLLSGYRGEIQGKLIGANAEVVVFPLTPDGMTEPAVVERKLRRVARVVAVAPVIYEQGMAYSQASTRGQDVFLKGIDPKSEQKVATIDRYLGDLTGLFARGRDGLPGCAIGADLARSLGVAEGERIVLQVPDVGRRAGQFSIRTAAFHVARIFRTNFYEYDAGWVFLRRDELRAFAQLSVPATVLEIRLDTIADTAEATSAIRDAVGEGYSVTDWESMNGNLFSALRIQQITLFLLIGLIVAVSAFNIVATLVMTVQEKKRDVGVLTSLGAEPRVFTRMFLWLGAMLGGLGIGVGLLFGTLICRFVTATHLISFPPGVAEIYFISYVPFVVRWSDLAVITVFSFLVVVLASLLPARRAARLDIAEALRYE